jgi:hypothetical protein
MRPRIDICIATSIGLSVVTLAFFWAFSSLFVEMSVFYIGLPFALSAFLFSYVLLGHDSAVWSFKIVHTQIPNIILGVITIVSVFAILSVPAYDGSILEWANIPLMNWLRCVASVFLAMFLPGYFLLKIIDLQNSLEISAAIPLAYILSIFITFVTGFGMLLTNSPISSLASFLLIAINLTLMAIYFIKSSLKNVPKTIVNLNLVEAGALLATLILVIVGNIYVMSNTLPFSAGDMWRHLAQALQYSKGFPIHEGMLIPGYPYLFHVCLAMVFQLSGLPSPTAYQLMFLLSFIAVLSFYSLVKQWIRQKRTSFVAILLVPLLGFGCLYAINLKIQNQGMTLFSVLGNTIGKTYDISNIMIIGPGLSNVVPLLFIVLPTLFLFIYLLRKKLNSAVRVPLFLVLTAVSYLGHISGAFFIGLTLFLYAIIMKSKSVRDGTFGGILGLFLVLIIDISAPAGVYILGTGLSQESQITFLVTLVLFISSYAISLILPNSVHIGWRPHFTNFKKSLASWAIIYTYLFSVMVWLYMLPMYDAFKFGGYSFTPFFVWPIRFGPIGLLFILVLSFCIKEVLTDKRLLFFLSLATTGFVLEQVSNYFPWFYPSYRFATLTWIGVLIIAAYGVAKGAQSLIGNRKILFTIILLVVTLPGMLSFSCYYYDRSFSGKTDITGRELEALSFLGRNLQSNSSVLTFTTASAAKLETFAAVNTLQVIQRWSDIILKTDNQEEILNLLAGTNTRYIYLTPEDADVLTASQSIFLNFLQYFPIVFSNEKATIYEVPSMSLPSGNQITVLNFLKPTPFGYEKLPPTTPYSSILTSLPSLSLIEHNFVSFPLTSEEEYNLTILDNCDSPYSWAISEGSGSIDIDTIDFKEGNSSICIKDIETDPNGYFAIRKAGSWDLENANYFSLWVKSPMNITKWVKIVFRAGDTYRVWIFKDLPADKWIKLIIPLDEPYIESKNPLDMSSIKSVEVGLTSNAYQNLSYFKIDQITFGNETTNTYLDKDVIENISNLTTVLLPYDPDFNVSALVDTVKKGVNLFVFNNPDQYGSFFKLLDLNVTGKANSNGLRFPSSSVDTPTISGPLISTGDENPAFISNYTLSANVVSPFTLSKEFGRGRIFYVNVAPILSLPEQDCIPLLTKIFGELISSANLHLIHVDSQSSEALPTYVNRIVKGNITITGSTRLNCSYASSVDPIFTPWVSIRANDIEEIFTNVSITRLNLFNSSIVTTNNSSIRLSAGLPSSYLTLSNQNGSFQSYFSIYSDLAILSLELENSTQESNLLVRDGVLELVIPDFDILLWKPAVEISGTASFEEATIASAPYVPLVGSIGDTIRIEGDVQFEIQSASSGLITISDFEYKGDAINLGDVTHPSVPLSIPWLYIISSPPHILLLACTIAGIIVTTRYLVKIELHLIRRNGKEKHVRLDPKSHPRN